MKSICFYRRFLTSLPLFIALSVVTCRGEFPPCTPASCNYSAPEKRLNCDHVGCSVLKNFSVWNHAVETLTIRGNHLVNVTLLGFPCQSLLKIDLSGNSITFIDHLAFRKCSNLTSIILDKNQLQIDLFVNPGRNPLFGLSSLSHLSLASNDIGDLILEPFSGEIQSLQLLNLSNNRIQKIDYKTFTDIIHLEQLDLSDNAVEKLDHRTFHGLGALMFLDFSRNKLSCLPANLFVACKRLEVLDLSQNVISAVDRDAFRGLDSLRVLRIGSNLLASIPAQLPTSLQELCLQNNPNLASLDSSNALPPSLTALSIRNCSSLKAIGSGSLSDLPSLTRIEITDNGCLDTVAKDAFDGVNSSVTHLNFSHNALTSLDRQLLDWKSVKEGDLSGNAWNCDCNLQWMRDAPLQQSMLRSVVCWEPKHLRGRSLASLDSGSKLKCSFSFRYRRQTAVALIGAVTVLFLLSSVLLVIKCRRTVLPCWFDHANKYETLYNATEAAFDSSESVSIVRATVNGHTSAGHAGSPTPV